MANCLVCGHKDHGATACKQKITNKAGKQVACGCKSHSSKFDSGAKFNPGAGKRARMIAANTRGGGGKT